MAFTAEQQAEIDKIIEKRLQKQRRVHDRELRACARNFEAMLSQKDAEIARLVLEVRQERGLVDRIRAWLSGR